MKKESALPDRPYGNLKGSKWALTALIRMKTTVAKTLANRPSAWQVTLPGFLPCAFIRKPLIFKGFRAVIALPGSRKNLARKKKHADFGSSTGRHLWAVRPAEGARVPTRTPTIFHGSETAHLDNRLPCGVESHGLLDTVSHFFFYTPKDISISSQPAWSSDRMLLYSFPAVSSQLLL